MSIRILPEAASGDETLPDAPTPSVDTPAILRSVERDIAFVLMAFVQYADVFGIESGVLMTIEHPTGASILAVGELTELPNDDILDMAELERAISGGDQKAITEWMREFDRSVSSFMEPLEYMVLPSTEGLSMTSMLLAEIRALKRTFSPSRLNCHIRLIGKKGT